MIWEFTSDGEHSEDEMHRTMATVAIHGGLLVVSDYSGLVHCVDAETGKRIWYHDGIGSIWSTPLIVVDDVYICDEEGYVKILCLSADSNVPMVEGPVECEPFAEIMLGQSIHGSPIFANGTLYIPTRSTLFAIADESTETATATTPPSGGHWPRWRGPEGTNLSTEKGLLQEWPEGGPPLAWRADGIGEGIASLSIAGGRLRN